MGDRAGSIPVTRIFQESLDDESSRLFLLGERLVDALYLLDLSILGKMGCLVIWAGCTGKDYF